MSKPYDEAWRILDAELVAAEAELEREKLWLEHDVSEEDILLGWVHDLNDVSDYEPPTQAA